MHLHYLVKLKIRVFCEKSNAGKAKLEKFYLLTLIFTARRYASAVLAVIVCPSVRLSVRLSVCHKSELYKDG